jgi:hypothetical protein
MACDTEVPLQGTEYRCHGLINTCHSKKDPLMNEPKKDAPRQSPPDAPKQNTPAHSTPEEKERLKDFNKDGIPPGVY